MRCTLFGLVAVAATVGCGGGSKPIEKLTKEQETAIKAQDQQTDEDEHSGSGKHTRKK
jgi:hypothetical protein